MVNKIVYVDNVAGEGAPDGDGMKTSGRQWHLED